MFFFFTATATTEIYTLSLHDALPISRRRNSPSRRRSPRRCHASVRGENYPRPWCGSWAFRSSSSSGYARSTHRRSEEHTSELQSHSDLVCRLLLEKKNKTKTKMIHIP